MYTNLFNDVTGTPAFTATTTAAPLAIPAAKLVGARGVVLRLDPSTIAANYVIIGESDVTSAGGGNPITALGPTDPPIIIPVPRINELFIVAAAGTPKLYVGVLT
jgi:hypothetical protein